MSTREPRIIIWKGKKRVDGGEKGENDRRKGCFFGWQPRVAKGIRIVHFHYQTNLFIPWAQHLPRSGDHLAQVRGIGCEMHGRLGFAALRVFVRENAEGTHPAGGHLQHNDQRDVQLLFVRGM